MFEGNRRFPDSLLERRTSPLTARSSIPMSGRATGGAIHLMPLSVMVCTSGRGMMTAMAAARSTAIPARGVARRSEPIRVVFGAFISDTCIFT